MKIEGHVSRFVEANAESPIVSASWLDANKRTAYGHPSTWKYQRVRLEDGRTFVLPEEAVALIEPRWKDPRP